MKVKLLSPLEILETDTMHTSVLEDLNDSIHINMATLSNEIVGGIDSFGPYRVGIRNGIPWIVNEN